MGTEEHQTTQLSGLDGSTTYTFRAEARPPRCTMISGRHARAQGKARRTAHGAVVHTGARRPGKQNGGVVNMHARPSALGRAAPLRWGRPPGTGAPTPDRATDQPGSFARRRVLPGPSSSAPIVQLTGTASRPLPAVASPRDGFASLDPAPTRKDFAAYEEDGGGVEALEEILIYEVPILHNVGRPPRSRHV
jgi:hypothetical protein